MSRCKWRSVNPDSRPVVMDERMADLILFSPLKDLSAEQLVTARVHKMLTKTLMLGYMTDMFLRVSVSVEGKLFCPYRQLLMSSVDVIQGDYKCLTSWTIKRLVTLL